MKKEQIMEEIFDVFNEKGEYLNKTASREVCHSKGLWHKAVTAFIINSKGQVLLQKYVSSDSWQSSFWLIF